jgi:rare lipoprotein A
MTGWRLGWIVAPSALMPDLGKLIEYNTSCAPAFVQRAGVIAINEGEPTVRHVAVKRIRHTPLKRPIETQFASHGIASFYSDEQPTASGERFDPNGMTAAHRSLPFGTRLRVTNLATGRSVTVRINDRGPYIPGRVVDVSYSAAESLGIVGRGVAKVKLDVVH